MLIRVGLNAGDLVSGTHRQLTVSAKAGLAVSGVGCQSIAVMAGAPLSVSAKGGELRVSYGGINTPYGKKLIADPKRSALSLFSKGPPNFTRSYMGQLEIAADGDKLRVVLITDLEQYVSGVLQSEVPASYHLEAMKAQAVLARTYGLYPRLSHAEEGFNVCDSFLHCQAFNGISALTPMQKRAIAQTSNQILKYQGKPALALFSACAGGHTEDYENCFSDPVTNAFPPPPIPYLKGVAEGKLPKTFPSEQALRELYATARPDTVDGASPSFRWQVIFSADDLDANMHHVIETMRKDPQFKPFILPPTSKKFGHIESFEVLRRGVAGTAMELAVHTSEGIWKIKKELAIRSIFANAEKKLKRLRSARLFFDHTPNRLGLLGTLKISGLGSGHGVGLQQTGAQGLATRGHKYKQILDHYYHGTEVGAP